MPDITVIFAPGTGGNHLANILSTARGFVPRMEWRNYDALSVNAHPEGDVVPELTINDQSRIRCQHLAQCIWQADHQHNQRMVVIELAPEYRTELFEQRVRDLYTWYDDTYLREEISTLYSLWSVTALTGCEDLTAVPVSMLFDKDVKPLLNHVSKNLDIELDVDLCLHMHQQWIEMLTRLHMRDECCVPQPLTRSRYDLDSESDY